MGTTAVGLADITEIDELNQISTFTATLANTTTNRATVAANISTPFKIYHDGALVLTGRVDVDKIVYTQTTIVLSGYASYIDLHFVFFSRDQGQYDIRRVQFDNTQADTILGFIVAGTGYTVVECPSTLISLRGEYESKLQWISAVAKACKYVYSGNTYSCDWWIDTAGGVHIKQERGSARGVLNLTDALERELDFAGIQNAAYGSGYGDGINQLSAVKTNAASVATYNSREVRKIDRRFMKQAALDDEMQEHVDTHSNPVESIPCSITTADWYGLGLSVGDTVTISDETTGIDGTYRIKRATITPVITVIEITNTVARLTSEIQDIKRQLYIDGGYMQGQTVPLNYSNMDNVQDGFPLKLNLHIPNKTVAINAAYISFDIELFRAYSTASSEESAHKHEFIIKTYHWDDIVTNLSGAIDNTVTTINVVSTADFHTWGTIYIDNEAITYNSKTPTSFTECMRGTGGTVAAAHLDAAMVDGPSFMLGGFYDDLGIPAIKMGGFGNDSPLKNETSEAGSAHTHVPNYGIMENTDNTPNISILIDTIDRTVALGGPWTVDVEELDITNYIQSTGKHTIELLSSKLGRLTADIWLQVFIQSD